MKQSLTSQMIDGVFPSSVKGDLSQLAKPRNEAPIKICYACYQLNYRAARICCGCFREFYPSKAKKNDAD